MKESLQILAVLMLFTAAGYLIAEARKESRKETSEHIDLKRELVRIDSLNRLQEKRMFDSLMHHVDSLHSKIADNEKIINRLQQQNAKLDAIYRSVHVVAMPDL